MYLRKITEAKTTTKTTTNTNNPVLIPLSAVTAARCSLKSEFRAELVYMFLGRLPRRLVNLGETQEIRAVRQD